MTLSGTRSLAAAAACALFLSACASSSGQAPVQVQSEPVSPEIVAAAEQSIEQGNYADAKLLLERVLLAEPGNLRARLAMAETQLAFGQLDAASEAFETLSKVPEATARAQQGRGLTLLLKGQERPALFLLEQAVDKDPGLWRAWNAIGTLHDRAGEWDAAAMAYDRALEIRPDSAMLYNNRGFSHLLRRDHQAAIADFDAALQLEPDMEAARENMRLAFAWAGQYDRALVGVSQKDIGRAFNNIGFVALLRGDLPAAESYLLRSMEIDPKFNRTANKNLEYLKSLKAINGSKVNVSEMEGNG
ncbi:tetratricopeptide repeat protein [Pelagibius marinus]|uniref:tetratricopeptide repeat protein n=1 Tax=Pelagibius marinus TaxID=2762760 RepID=UPI00187302CE|nr:tetratricopeptide repeat protein [Pelagibius marinus]